MTSSQTYQQPDSQGYYGQFGGAYIPEMLHKNVAEYRLPQTDHNSLGYQVVGMFEMMS